jgi:hypothetical protein
MSMRLMIMYSLSRKTVMSRNAWLVCVGSKEAWLRCYVIVYFSNRRGPFSIRVQAKTDLVPPSWLAEHHFAKYPPRLFRRPHTLQYSRMLDESIAAGTLASQSLQDERPSWLFYIAVVCLIWYTAVVLVSTLGYVQV